MILDDGSVRNECETERVLAIIGYVQLLIKPWTNVGLEQIMMINAPM
jgi:hypothetical protein